MAQRYSDEQSLKSMAAGRCPECDKHVEAHMDDPRFWVPRTCSLLSVGVEDRIAQYQADLVDR